MSSSSSEDEDKPPTAFANQLYTLLDNDRQNVDRDSKYTAFWLAHGMTLSSQYRQVQPHCLHTVCVSQCRRSCNVGSSARCLLERSQRLLVRSMAAAVLLMHRKIQPKAQHLYHTKDSHVECLQNRSTWGLAAQVLRPQHRPSKGQIHMWSVL